MESLQPCEGCRKLATELEDAQHDAIEEHERLLVAEDLGRALGTRLLARHQELRALRAVPIESGG